MKMYNALADCYDTIGDPSFYVPNGWSTVRKMLQHSYEVKPRLGDLKNRIYGQKPILMQTFWENVYLDRLDSSSRAVGSLLSKQIEYAQEAIDRQCVRAFPSDLVLLRTFLLPKKGRCPIAIPQYKGFAGDIAWKAIEEAKIGKGALLDVLPGSSASCFRPFYGGLYRGNGECSVLLIIHGMSKGVPLMEVIDNGIRDEVFLPYGAHCRIVDIRQNFAIPEVVGTQFNALRATRKADYAIRLEVEKEYQPGELANNQHGYYRCLCM